MNTIGDASCIFCKIANRKAPASIVYGDRDVLALLDINPVQRGHTLVIPKKHFVNIWDIDSDILAKVVSITQKVAHRLREVMPETEGINTFNANGKPAGQDVYHFHMHVIPLARGERTKFAKWWEASIERNVDRSFLDSLAEKLRFP
jgi:histidine triad (HIT) family protein